MSPKLKIAIVQMSIAWENPDANCTKIEEWVLNKTEDADLVVLPEMFATGFNMNPAEIAQEMDGEIVTRMQALAVKSGKAIIGSVAIHDHIRREKPETGYYNRLFFWTPDGVYLTYNKRHLFRMAGEHEVYQEGHTKLIVHYKGFRICPMICYDLRFPVWSRQHSGQEYDVLVYIACWPEVRRYPWSTLLKARAIENLAYVVGVDAVGEDPKNTYSGDSVILDYLGMPMAEVTPYKEGIAFATLDMDPLEQFRQKFPAYMDADRFSIQLEKE